MYLFIILQISLATLENDQKQYMPYNLQHKVECGQTYPVYFFSVDNEGNNKYCRYFY